MSRPFYVMVNIDCEVGPGETIPGAVDKITQAIKDLRNIPGVEVIDVSVSDWDEA